MLLVYTRTVRAACDDPKISAYLAKIKTSCTEGSLSLRTFRNAQLLGQRKRALSCVSLELGPMQYLVAVANKRCSTLKCFDITWESTALRRQSDYVNCEPVIRPERPDEADR